MTTTKKILSAALAASVVLGAAGTASASPSPIVVVVGWFHANDRYLSSLDQDMTAMGTAGATYNLTAMTNDCTKMTKAARTVKAHPVAYAPLQAHLTVGMNDFIAAGNNCVAGIASTNMGQLQQAIVEMDSGADQLALVTNIVTNLAKEL